MIKFAAAAFLSIAALGLTACGSSESAKEQAQPDNVEMPAEEAVSDLSADATPMVDASAQPDAAAATTSLTTDAAVAPTPAPKP